MQINIIFKVITMCQEQFSCIHGFMGLFSSMATLLCAQFRTYQSLFCRNSFLR